MNQKELFWISLTVFLTILVWMFLDIYRLRTTVKVDNGLESLQVIDFKLKPDVLKVLKTKNP